MELPDAVETAVGPNRTEHAAVVVPHAAEMDLRRPAGLRVSHKPLIQPCCLELPDFNRVKRFHTAYFLEDTAKLLPGVGFGDNFSHTVIGKQTAMLLEVAAAYFKSLQEVFPIIYLHLGRFGEPVNPAVPGVRLPHLGGHIAPPGRQHLHTEAGSGDIPVIFQTVNGVVRGADHPHIGTLHQLTGRKTGLCQLRIAFFPDGRGRFGAKAVINAEIAGKLQLRPIEKRTAQQVVHRLRIFQELVIVGGITGAIPLRHPVGAHLPPLVVVRAQPELRHVVPTAVFRNLLR